MAHIRLLEVLEDVLRRALAEVEGCRQFLEQRQAQRARALEVGGKVSETEKDQGFPPMPGPAPRPRPAPKPRRPDVIIEASADFSAAEKEIACLGARLKEL